MRCAVALGSNVGDRLAHLRAGKTSIKALHQGPGSLLASRVYETEPVDCAPGTAAYLNAVIELETSLNPQLLLSRLQEIERAEGRPASHGHNQPRTLDLDLLYAGDVMLQTEALILPHPRMTSRRFVMQPLADIRPGLILPGCEKSIAWLLSALPEKPAVHPFDIL